RLQGGDDLAVDQEIHLLPGNFAPRDQLGDHRGAQVQGTHLREDSIRSREGRAKPGHDRHTPSRLRHCCFSSGAVAHAADRATPCDAEGYRATDAARQWKLNGYSANSRARSEEHTSEL